MGTSKSQLAWGLVFVQDFCQQKTRQNMKKCPFCAEEGMKVYDQFLRSLQSIQKVS